jgi:hypothetical protein
MTCSGNSAEICGGPDRISIYATGAAQVAAAPVAQTSGLPGSWGYRACISHDVGRIILPYQVGGLGTTNSATTCWNQCAAMGILLEGWCIALNAGVVVKRMLWRRELRCREIVIWDWGWLCIVHGQRLNA